ncbi:MAG: type II secretion system F family protein [Candidatus Diapherotrites archaeon]|nr:type II secretion system F family protein [Candidatus Diapherotrites archaeon]
MIRNAWLTYKEYLREIHFFISPTKWLIISIVLSICLGIVAWLLLGEFEVIKIGKIHAAIISFLLFIAVIDLMITYPYLMSVRRIAKMEEFLPDAFRQMADTLKAGGTFEYALRTVSSAEYGPLTYEIALVLRRLEEGENLSNALKNFAYNVNSRVIKRAVDIILDSISAGASLADILDEIADDVRATHRITRERKSSTTMQVLFMVVAGVLVAPLILGLITSIVNFLLTQTIKAVSAMPTQVGSLDSSFFCNANHFITPTGVDYKGYWGCVSNALMILLIAYIIIEATAASFMVAMIRDGTISKSFIYIPFFLFIAYLIYYLSFVLTSLFFGR